jgi:hypothetical protein
MGSLSEIFLGRIKTVVSDLLARERDKDGRVATVAPFAPPAPDPEVRALSRTLEEAAEQLAAHSRRVSKLDEDLRKVMRSLAKLERQREEEARRAEEVSSEAAAVDRVAALEALLVDAAAALASAPGMADEEVMATYTALNKRLRRTERGYEERVRIAAARKGRASAAAASAAQQRREKRGTIVPEGLRAQARLAVGHVALLCRRGVGGEAQSSSSSYSTSAAAEAPQKGEPAILAARIDDLEAQLLAERLEHRAARSLLKAKGMDHAVQAAKGTIPAAEARALADELLVARLELSREREAHRRTREKLKEKKIN